MKGQIALVGAAGACFLKFLRTFWAQKASYQTSISLFWKAELSTCFWCNKNRENCEVWWPRTLVLWISKGNCGTRNFRTFEEQSLETKSGKYCCLLPHGELTSKNIMGMCSWKGWPFHWARLTIIHLHFQLSC